MSHPKPLAAAILAITLSCVAYAAPAEAGGGRGGGGGGYGSGGGGGAPYSGGGGMRASGGPDFDAGAPRSGGATRADEGPRLDADMRGGADPGSRHFAGDGGRYFSSRFAGPRFAGRAFSHGGDRSTIGDNPTNGGSRNANSRSAAVQRLLNSHAMASALHDREALRDPAARARIVAAAAAGRDDRNEHGWWRHRHRGHGWVGPLFWPFAYDDDDAIWGYGDDRAFWDYGYKDIYAGIFPRYGHDDLTGDSPPDGATAPERQASRAPAGPVKSAATTDPATSQTTARPATPQATARQATSKATARPATPQAAARPTTAQATAQPTAPQATAQPVTPQATAQPTTSQAMAQTTTPQAAVQPATPKAMAQPAAPQATVQPAAPKATAQPATSKAAAQPTTSTARPTTAQAIVHPAPNHLTQMCGEDSRDIAGLPIDQIQRAIAPNEAQLAALDELGNASMKAAQDIRTACPTQISAAAPGRLAMMQQRVEAMIAAVLTVRPALDKFYGLLDDGQKAKLNGIGPNQRSNSGAQRSGGSLVQNCGSAQAGATDWPIAEIEAKLQLTATQRESLTALVDASAKASDMFKEACQPDVMLAPPARLAAIGNRLDVMRLAIKTVLTALDDFYDQLTEEQKAQFEAIGPGHTDASAGEAKAGEPTAAPARRDHGRPRASISGGTL